MCSLFVTLGVEGVLHEHVLHLLHLLSVRGLHHLAWWHHELLLRHLLAIGIHITVVEVLHGVHEHHLLLEIHGNLLLHNIVHRNFFAWFSLIHHSHHFLLLFVLNESGNLRECELVQVLKFINFSSFSQHLTVVSDWQFRRHLFPLIFLHQCFELFMKILKANVYLPVYQVVQ